MSKWDKLREKILSGRADANLAFRDVCNLLVRDGWNMRIRGSHHVFEKAGLKPLNLQAIGPNAKSYQVRQVREALQEQIAE